MKFSDIPIETDVAVPPGETRWRQETLLKRCPFCGGKAAIIEVEETDNRGGFVVQCGSCECSTRVWFPIKDDVKRILADAWNQRVETKRRVG